MAKCKRCGLEKQNISCSFCKQRGSSKFRLIDWEQTKSEYNYDDNYTLQKTDNIIITCACGNSKVMLWRSVRKYSAACRSCTSKALWEDQEYRNKLDTVMHSDGYKETHRAACTTKEHKARLAESSTASWNNPGYRTRMTAKIHEFVKTEQYLERQSKQSKRKWKSEEYREKQHKSAQCKNTLEFREHISDIVKEHWTKERREAVSKIVQELWLDDDYRGKTSTASKRAMESQEVREAIAGKMVKLWADSEYKERMTIIRANMPRISSIQLQLYKYLDDLNIEFHREGTNTAIGYYAFDCLVPKQCNMAKHLLIECQGDYWHSSQDAQRRDRSKFTYIDKYFPEYEIVYVWEHEFYTKDRVLDRLKLKLGVDVEIVSFDFEDVQIREVSSRDVKEFLDAYHYIGKGRGGKCLGAFLDNNLIACVVFSSPLRQNTAGQFDLIDGEVRELSRLCIHPSYHKKNFASWFIARSIKLLADCRLVVAYADRTVGHTGTIYKASGFGLHHTVPADYWYIDKDGYVMHKRTLYGKARQMKMVESEYASNYGYIKKWGGDKLCFIREIGTYNCACMV